MLLEVKWWEWLNCVIVESLSEDLQKQTDTCAWTKSLTHTCKLLHACKYIPIHTKSSLWSSLYRYMRVFTHDELVLTFFSISTEIVLDVNVNHRVHIPRATRDRRTALLSFYRDSERVFQPFYLWEKHVHGFSVAHFTLTTKITGVIMKQAGTELSVFTCLCPALYIFSCITSKCNGVWHGYKCSFHTSWRNVQNTQVWCCLQVVETFFILLLNFSLVFFCFFFFSFPN